LEGLIQEHRLAKFSEILQKFTATFYLRGGQNNDKGDQRNGKTQLSLLMFC
jgi:hypothetical protein